MHKELLEMEKKETPAGSRYKPRQRAQLRSIDIEEIVEAYKTNG